MKKIIKHPLFVSIFSLLAGVLLTECVKRNSAPLAKIVPDKLSINAAENVTFSASGSSDPDNDKLLYDWSVGGAPINTTPIGFCSSTDDNLQLSCKFTSPGNHIITIRITDEHTATSSANASVRVIIPGGYIGFLIQYGSSGRDLNLIRAVNCAIDWVKIQANLRGKPIVIYDPDSNSDVFAVTIERSILKAKEYLKASGGGAGLKVLVPSSVNISKQIQGDLEEAGIHAAVVPMPFGEVYTALTQGLSNTGFIPLSSSEELLNYYK